MRIFSWVALLLVSFAVLSATAAADKHKLGRHYSSRATVYSTGCDGQGSLTADGFNLDRHPRARVIASTWLPLHTRIRFDHRVYGHYYYMIRDTGGYFDIFRPNCSFGSWNNPVLGFRVVIR